MVATPEEARRVAVTNQARHRLLETLGAVQDRPRGDIDHFTLLSDHGGGSLKPVRVKTVIIVGIVADLNYTGEIISYCHPILLLA